MRYPHSAIGGYNTWNILNKFQWLTGLVIFWIYIIIATFFVVFDISWRWHGEAKFYSEWQKFNCQGGREKLMNKDGFWIQRTALLASFLVNKGFVYISAVPGSTVVNEIGIKSASKGLDFSIFKRKEFCDWSERVIKCAMQTDRGSISTRLVGAKTYSDEVTTWVFASQEILHGKCQLDMTGRNHEFQRQETKRWLGNRLLEGRQGKGRCSVQTLHTNGYHRKVWIRFWGRGDTEREAFTIEQWKQVYAKRGQSSESRGHHFVQRRRVIKRPLASDRWRWCELWGGKDENSYERFGRHHWKAQKLTGCVGCKKW